MTVEELSAKLAETQTQLDAMKERAVKAERQSLLSSMTEQEKKAFTALPTEKQEAYFQADEPTRKTQLAEAVKAVQKSDEAVEMTAKVAELETSKADLEKRLKAAEDLVAAEKRIRETTELTTEVREKYAHMEGKEEEKIETLRAIKALPELQRDAILKSWSIAEKAALSLMTGRGESGRGETAASSAYEKLEAKAREIRKANPELSEAKAIVKAAEQNPELAEEASQQR